MNWQGIPFPFEHAGFLDTGILTLNKIPTIAVDSGFSWDSVIGAVVGALVGAAIPSAIAWYSIKKNDELVERQRNNQRLDLEKNIDTQLQISKLSFSSQVLSGNRQLWINTLRGYCAECVSLAEQCIHNKSAYEIAKNGIKSGSATQEDKFKYFDNFSQASFRFSELLAHIELMLNPTEPISNKIILALKKMRSTAAGNIDDFYKKGSETRASYEKNKKKFIKVCQTCLKSEWDRVKKGI